MRCGSLEAVRRGCIVVMHVYTCFLIITKGENMINKVMKLLTLLVMSSTAMLASAEQTWGNGGLLLDMNDIAEMRSLVNKELRDLRTAGVLDVEVAEDVEEYDPISDYETSLPHATQPEVSPLETALLSAYLDNPSSVQLSKVLAAYHLFHLPNQYVTRHNRYSKGVGAVKHAVYASYFLRRAQTLGSDAPWLERAEARTVAQLAHWLPTDLPIDQTEGNEAHMFFLNAFNYNEADRYVATDKCLKICWPTQLTW